MNGPLETLIDCLRQQEMLLEKLLLIMNSERGLISELDVTGLDQAREDKLSLVTLLNQSKAACKQALDDSAASVGLASAEKLSDLVKAVGPSRGQVLGNLRNRLIDLVDSVNRVNRFNASLFQGSLRMVNRSLEFYNNCFGSADTYSGSGMMKPDVAAGRLVRGEI